ncbi:MAG: Lrp/AsnC family transcriptional regulator [Truepera sp.]|jgi:Lrp/AsnC family transcriptional regulator for asnA, asnC and gidA|nr:Lrp/AsnC family transcriptional regulator [Truepera sp.]
MRIAERALDAIDSKLIRLLEEDGRASYAFLAAQLGVSTGTARNRLQRLFEQQVIQVAAYANPNRDVAVRAFIGFSVEAMYLKSAAQALIEDDCIRYAAISAGSFDIVALGEFSSKNAMLTFVASTVGGIQGIKGTQSFVLLSVLKSLGKVIEPLREEGLGRPL